MSETPEGVYARIPLEEVSLIEAVSFVDDSTFWYETMALILFYFSVNDYWQLTVGDHRRLYDFLISRGLADGD